MTYYIILKIKLHIIWIKCLFYFGLSLEKMLKHFKNKTRRKSNFKIS